MIFDIQRFSTHDGAGIRTIVFFKGCSMRCAWCENPESQSFGYELAYDERKCIRCLDCMQLARDGEIELDRGRPRLHRERIRNPEKFARVCPTGALTVIGESKSIAEIVAEIKKDLPFFRKSGGGVTLSGGEPYDQPEFLLDLLRALDGMGLKAAVETSLNVPWTAIESSLPYVEALLADVKHTDAAKLKAFTGGKFSLVLENLRRLEKSGTPVTVRVPLIPGFNDGASEIKDIVTLASSLRNVREIHFLPFHTLGVGKYRLLAKEYRFLKEAPHPVDMGRYLNLARSMGLEAIVGG